MSISELKAELTGREAVYRLLSACYYQPCPEWNQAELFANLIRLCAAVFPQAVVTAKNMSEAWSVVILDELTVEYARLFVGPLTLLAPPYGSVYLEKDKQVMGESTLSVMRFYREAGLRMDVDFTEMPDHIAVELECVSYLLQRAVAAVDEVETLQWLNKANIFRDQFLGGWCSRFCETIRSNSESAFYHALADITELVVFSPVPSAAK